MNYKMKKVIFSGVILAVVVIAVVNMVLSNNLPSGNKFVLQNAEALTQECETGRVTGSPMDGRCNTPMSTGSSRKCTTTIITCQGSTNCCTPRKCSLHN
jgi:hypothetical protein